MSRAIKELLTKLLPNSTKVKVNKMLQHEVKYQYN